MTTKVKKTKERKSRAKQAFLPTLEPPSIPEIDTIADEFFDLLEEKASVKDRFDQCRDVLVAKMKDHGLLRYETPDGLIVTIEAKSVGAVKKKKQPKQSPNGDGHEE